MSVLGTNDGETATAFPPDNRLWTTEEVADFLQVSGRTIFNLRKLGFPCIQLGGTIRFEPQAVKDYLASHPNLSLHRLRQLVRRKSKSP